MSEINFPKDEAHQYLKLEDAVGKDIICLDGVTRTVETIDNSVGDLQMAIINATPTFEGYQINLVSLFSQLRGKGIPSDALTGIFKDIAERFTVDYQGKEEQDPNKIYLPIMKNVRDFSKYKKNKKKRK